MEKCDFYHIIVLSLNFPGYLKMEYGSTKMEERLSRSPGGKLALWAFYTWCGYFVWALVGFLFMALVGALLGSIAWYTRPRPARSRRYE
ncbi:permease [Escherichia coli]|nr:permease [Escherichia coli]ELQ3700794.1 permease [Escherichia coli]